MDEWEYLTLDLQSYESPDTHLDELGVKGWKLVTVIVLSRCVRQYFKRRVNE